MNKHIKILYLLLATMFLMAYRFGPYYYSTGDKILIGGETEGTFMMVDVTNGLPEIKIPHIKMGFSEHLGACY